MRVITGTARGRKLKTPSNYDVRPTTDNVKEALFNILMNDVEGRRVLDLFSGSGQLGIEALSRGAAKVVFTDNDPASIKLTKENLKICGFEGEVIRTDALSFLKRGNKFDLIFIDPPYDSMLYEDVLNTINEFDILSVGGIIAVECRIEKNVPEMKEPYRKIREYRYGKVKITTFTRGASI